MSAKLRVNMISETTFTVRGHGVHTAFVEMTNGLRQVPSIDVVVNKFRKADITHIQTIGPYSLAQLLFGRGRKVVSVHVIPDSFIGSIRGAKQAAGLSRRYLRWFYGKADMLLPVSEETERALKNELKLTNPMQVYFNTVDKSEYESTPSEKAAARDKLKLSPNDFVVVGNGQIQPRKRFDTFTQLAKELPDMKFIWIGGIPFKRLGADYAHMQKMVDEAPANLQVTGVIELAEVRDYFRAASAFVLPSNQENHPLALLEAAASSLPLLVRDIPEYDSAFGNLVLRCKEEDFKTTLQKLHQNPAFYQKAVKQAQEIAERFNTASAIHQLVDVYKRLTEHT